MRAASRARVVLVLLTAGGAAAFQAPALAPGRGSVAWCQGRGCRPGVQSLAIARARRPLRAGPTGVPAGCAGGGVRRLQATAYHVGTRVEVRWQGEWWPGTVQEVRCQGGGGEGTPDALRVRFDGGSDEEWVKIASGDVRVPRPAPSFGESASDDEAAGSDAGEYWADNMTPVQAGLLEELLEYRLPPGSRALELGAGSRSVVPMERIESLYGVGLRPERMEANKALAGFEAVDLNAPGLKLNLPDDKFDAVLCNVLPYIKEPVQLLREARRCMKEDGVIVVSWLSIPTHEQQTAKHWRDRPGLVPARARVLARCA